MVQYVKKVFLLHVECICILKEHTLCSVNQPVCYVTEGLQGQPLIMSKVIVRVSIKRVVSPYEFSHNLTSSRVR